MGVSGLGGYVAQIWLKVGLIWEGEMSQKGWGYGMTLDDFAPKIWLLTFQ